MKHHLIPVLNSVVLAPLVSCVLYISDWQWACPTVCFTSSTMTT